MTGPSLFTLRREAQKQGMRVSKVSERSRDYWQYGPFALADASTGLLVAYGMDLDQVAAELSCGWEPRRYRARRTTATKPASSSWCTRSRFHTASADSDETSGIYEKTCTDTRNQ